MKNFVVDHELIMEYTLSYVLEAKNLVKKFSNDFDVAFLPSKHHLYTGVIQAAAYQLLKRKNKVILVFP
jgi:hypothetical protein